MKRSEKKWLGLNIDLEVNEKNGSPKDKTPEKNFTKKKLNLDYAVIARKPSFDFHKKLTPKEVSDLAVHPKKISEVDLWIQKNICDSNNNSQNAKFLLITGPTGSGKTITVEVLCKSKGIDVSEWLNPLDQDLDFCNGPNQISRFTEFLTESKWNSLFATSDKKVILVEEFPNSLIRNPEEFGNILEECFYKGNYPIIFICTDTSDSKMSLADKLFTPEIRNKFNIPEISFNVCAPTLLKNALKRAHNLVQSNPKIFKIPSSEVVNAITATAMGDIKSAINQYYFASLLGTSDLPIIVINKLQKAGGKRKRNGSSSGSIRAMLRDQNLGLFHGIGKVLNPKRIEKENTWRLECDFEKLIDEFSTQPGNFTSFLFENYLKYFSQIKDVSNAVDTLSLSQSFIEKWIDRHEVHIYSLWICILGLMIYNEHKVSKWTQITGPKKIPKRNKINANGQVAAGTDLFYINIINKVENTRFN